MFKSYQVASQFPRFGFFARSLSHTSKDSAKRFIQTAPVQTNEASYVPYQISTQQPQRQEQAQSTSQSQKTEKLQQQTSSSTWSRHTISSSRSFKDILNDSKIPKSHDESKAAAIKETTEELKSSTEIQALQPKKRVRRTLKPRKALITLSPTAISHLRGLLDQPTPQLIRIGVRNRGCSGLTYNLEYIEKPNKFDEVVEQDGVKVVIDSKALFSIVGSEMDWLDDKLSSRFVFKNPNSKGTCGCGESFMV